LQKLEAEMSKSKKTVLIKVGSARSTTRGGATPPRVEPLIGGYFPI
jgi:hypothetical protein